MRDDRDDDRDRGDWDRGRWSDDRPYRSIRHGRSDLHWEDRMGFHPDDRFIGRGAHWSERRDRYGVEHTGYHDGYEGMPHGRDMHAYGYGPYGREMSWRGPRYGGYGAGPWGREYGERRWIGRHRGKGPQGYVRPDDRIRESVCEALTDDEDIDATYIDVVVKNGEVLLTGIVEDRATKRAAEDLVEQLPGVRDIQNQLRIGDRAGNQRPGSAVGRQETEMPFDRKPRA